MNGSVDDFKKELADLIKKYDVDIEADVDGGGYDFHGSVQMIISSTANGREFAVLSNGECITYQDLIK
jgi:hypothetical protein